MLIFYSTNVVSFPSIETGNYYFYSLLGMYKPFYSLSNKFWFTLVIQLFNCCSLSYRYEDDFIYTIFHACLTCKLMRWAVKSLGKYSITLSEFLSPLKD